MPKPKHAKPSNIDAIARARRVLDAEAAAIARMSERLDGRITEAVELMMTAGHVVTLGVGKSGIVARKVSATMASTGTPSFFLHPAEAAHGDFGRLTRGDLILAFSYSGETEEVLRLLPLIEQSGFPLISIVGRMNSTLAKASRVALDAGVDAEACPLGLAPTTSTTAAMALGDALSMALLELRGFRAEDFAFLHPAGRLGRDLLRVADVMHAGRDLPRVSTATAMLDVIHEISRKGFGITTVTDDDARLLGVISDGDFRRLMERHPETALAMTAGDVIGEPHPRNPRPRTVTAGELATHALHLMEYHRITALVVVDGENRVEGVVHLHDLWKVLFPNQPLQED